MFGDRQIPAAEAQIGSIGQVSTSRELSAGPAYGPELAEMIVAASQRTGGPAGRLPTERQLALQLGVTRTMVRNALALLEAEGRVSREVGRGTFLIATRDRPTGADPVDSTDLSPADVMSARRLFEPQVLRLVVAHATSRDFDKLERCLTSGEKARTYDEFDAADFALHHAIIAAAHNPLVLEMYAVLEQARQGAMWGNMKRRGDSQERRARSVEDHRRLVGAICARELDDAVAAMDHHLGRVESHLLGADRA
jgi:GntR family uxuAB operon transcriptional repressor